MPHGSKALIAEYPGRHDDRYDYRAFGNSTVKVPARVSVTYHRTFHRECGEIEAKQLPFDGPEIVCGSRISKYSSSHSRDHSIRS